MRTRPVLYAAVAAAVIGSLAPAASATSATPGPVRHVSATSKSSGTIALSWQNPSTSSFAATLVRMATGSVAPASPTRGTKAALVAKGHHSVSVSALKAGTRYSFALFATDGHGHYSSRATTWAVTGPGPVTGIEQFDHGSYVSVDWTNPTTATFSGLTVRYAKGSVAPATPTAGTAVTPSWSKTKSVRLTGLARDTEYSVSVWSHDTHRRYSTRTVTHFYTQETTPAPGSVSGMVTDTAGHPLAGVVVSEETFVAFFISSGSGGGASPDSAGDPAPTSTTGPDGRYTLALAPGSYFLAFDGSHATGGDADATGYVTGERAATIPSGRAISAPDLRLAAGAAITGVVTDSTGQPVSGARPMVVPVQPYVLGGSVGVDAAGGTDAIGDPSAADGSYTVKGVSPGAEQVCFFGTSAASDGCQARSLFAQADQTTAVPETKLGAVHGGSVSGTVTSGGTPVADALVELVPRNPNAETIGGVAFTGDDGAYHVNGVPAGRYEACANASVSEPPAGPPTSTGSVPGCAEGSITVRTNQATTADIALARAGAVTGKLVGPRGGPVAGAQVDIEGGPDASGGQARTDARGHFTVTGLPTGTYQACFDASGVVVSGHPSGLAPGCYGHRATFHVVAGQTRLGIDGRLGIGGAISGLLRDGAGHPAAGAFVDVEPDRGDTSVDGNVQTDAHGKYDMTGLAAGKYDVCFFAESGDFACAPHAITVQVGATTANVNAQLLPAGKLTVTVTDGGGHPVVGADVAVLAPCPGSDAGCSVQHVFGTSNVETGASDVTDSAGHVTFAALPPGKYAVCTFAYYGVTAADDPDDGFADTCTGTGTFTVTVSANATTAVTQALDPAGSVSGTVTDELGDPLSGVRLKIAGSAANDYDNGDEGSIADPPGLAPQPSAGPQGDAYTGTDGTFTVTNVAAGDQRVCVDASGAVGGTSTTGYANRCLTAQVTVTAGATTSGVVIKLKAA